MRVGHVFVGLVFLLALRVSECPLNNVSSTSRHLTSCCNLGAYFFRLVTLSSAEEIGVLWIDFLFHWISWILSIVFITIAMELDLMNHCIIYLPSGTRGVVAQSPEREAHDKSD